jgi:hypothetical protein
MLMNNTSANPTGLTALQLAAALTQLQWTELEKFADKRLRRCLNTPGKQRALAIYDGRTFVHTAVEQFALGDLGCKSGRKLAAGNRVSAATFIHAMHAAINSLISNILGNAEFSRHHLPVGQQEAERGVWEPQEKSGLGDQLEMRDLEQQLFTRLEQDAGDDQQQQTAVEALKNDCIAGHACGENGLKIDPELKRHVRREARAIWDHLTME